MNSSSSSIVVTWDDVPAEHQNGIITGYRVYVRKSGSSEGWSEQDVGDKQFSASGLDFWTFYDIKISAKTSVGEGVQSAVVSSRTDEDCKKQLQCTLFFSRIPEPQCPLMFLVLGLKNYA